MMVKPSASPYHLTFPLIPDKTLTVLKRTRERERKREGGGRERQRVSKSQRESSSLNSLKKSAAMTAVPQTRNGKGSEARKERQRDHITRGEGGGEGGGGGGKKPSLKRLIRPNQSLSLESVFTSLFAESPDGRQRMPDESRNWMELFRGSMIDRSCTTITRGGPPGQRGRCRRDCQPPPPCLCAKLKRPPVV